MSRYIDADALMNVFSKLEFSGDMGDAMEILDNYPTTDVVEIVRCKDCKFNPKRSWVSCPMAGRDTRKDDDFCSYGERVTE